MYDFLLLFNTFTPSYSVAGLPLISVIFNSTLRGMHHVMTEDKPVCSKCIPKTFFVSWRAADLSQLWSGQSTGKQLSWDTLVNVLRFHRNWLVVYCYCQKIICYVQVIGRVWMSVLWHQSHRTWLVNQYQAWLFEYCIYMAAVDILALAF